MGGLLFETDHPFPAIQFDDSKMLRVFHGIAEDRCSLFPASGTGQHLLKSLAVEDVISQDEDHMSLADEVATDEKSLGQASGFGLHRVADGNADAAPVAEYSLEVVHIPRRRNDQNIPDAAEHQCRQRIVDHRLIKDRQQLFAHRHGDRVEARPRAAGQDYALLKDPIADHCAVSPLNGQTQALTLIGTRGHALDPLRVFQVPLHGPLQTRFEGYLGAPAQYTLDLGRVHGIATVVAGTIPDQANEGSTRRVGQTRPKAVHRLTDGFNDLEVGALTVAADIVNFAEPARLEHPP